MVVFPEIQLLSLFSFRSASENFRFFLSKGYKEPRLDMYMQKFRINWTWIFWISLTILFIWLLAKALGFIQS